MENKILHIINQPFSVSSKDLFLIEDEIEKYPYFQTLHLLKAKAVSGAEIKVFQKVLAKTSIFCTNRQILFEYLKKENIQNESLQEIIISETEQSNIILDEKETNLPPIETPTVNENQEPEVSKLIETHQKLKSDEKTEDEKYIETEISTKSRAKVSFNHWLQKNQKAESHGNDSDSVNEKFKVIEDFLDKNPKITPAKDFKPSIEIQTTNKENMSHLMTETLAKIYVEQNKFDKAIKAYTILRLKYPEKSGYFADLIREIQELKHK